MAFRERRPWTALEDQLLLEAIQKEEADVQAPTKWHAVARHTPDRTNKDCRKRWYAIMAANTIVKGTWAPDEDERLVTGIAKHGTRWSLVASVVGTRNSDQCAKRWTDTLNPAIDRTKWTSEADAQLIKAVEEHGKVWSKIVKMYFPGKPGLAAKNRYNSLMRTTALADDRRHPESPDEISSRGSSSPPSPLSSKPLDSDLSVLTLEPDYQPFNVSRRSSALGGQGSTSAAAYSMQTHSSYEVGSPYSAYSLSSALTPAYRPSDAHAYGESAQASPFDGYQQSAGRTPPRPFQRPEVPHHQAFDSTSMQYSASPVTASAMSDKTRVCDDFTSAQGPGSSNGSRLYR